MRDFSRTGEPSGDAARAQAGKRFVIQQHAARRMHFDFRLELGGVLLSWSVPKGPSLSPRDRRLAVRTEDHPLDYADFEGVIPPGEYGGGTVAVWDRGTWEPEDGADGADGAGDAGDALARGKLTFTLHGQKLHGRWHLVRTRSSDKAENWLLFKGRDAAASDEVDVVASQPASVVSGKTVEQIAAAPERVWHGDRATEPTVADRRAARIDAARHSAAHDRARERSDRSDLIALVQQLPLGFTPTHLTKVLYPEQGLTKGELIGYLAAVSEWALPHIADRPLTLVRCPDGVGARGRGRGCFFQKHILPGSPPSIERVPIVEDTGETADYMKVRDLAGLAALAQLGTLEIHTWGAHADQPERPDLMVFDLDPDVGLGWERVALGAFELRRRLSDLGLESFVKTTGGKGLHVVAPIARGIGWDELKAFTRAVVTRMEHDEPLAYTTNLGKAHRRGKIYLDHLRNGRGATFIAPYSPRARAGAPVAVPISWEELAHGVDPATFTTVTVPRRLVTLKSDPWREIARIQQSITPGAWHAVGGKPAPAAAPTRATRAARVSRAARARKAARARR